jgi:hypothetical protein
MFSQHALKGGHDLTQYTMQFFAFVPNPAGYVTVLHKTDGSFSVCAWENVPPELDAVLKREASEGNGVHRVTVGMRGSYVVVMNNGIILWSGVPEPLGRLLADAMVEGRGVAVSPMKFFTAGTRPLIGRSTTPVGIPLPHHG